MNCHKLDFIHCRSKSSKGDVSVTTNLSSTLFVDCVMFPSIAAASVPSASNSCCSQCYICIHLCSDAAKTNSVIVVCTCRRQSAPPHMPPEMHMQKKIFVYKIRNILLPILPFPLPPCCMRINEHQENVRPTEGSRISPKQLEQRITHRETGCYLAARWPLSCR